jgi:hypothetical protein
VRSCCCGKGIVVCSWLASPLLLRTEGELDYHQETPPWPAATTFDPHSLREGGGVVYPLAAANVSRPLVSRLKSLHQPVVRASHPIFSSSFAPPCLLVDMPVSLRLTIIFLVNPLPDLVLRPRRHSEQQHLFQAPHTIGQARSHRRGARPPLRG